MLWKRLPPLATVALVALSVQATGAGSAVAAGSTGPTGGDASSVASVLSLHVGGLTPHTLQAVNATMSASTLTSPFAAVVDVVPLNVDGTKVGQKKVTQGTQSAGPISQSFPGALSLTGPKVVISASSDATQALAHLTSDSLGAASILGLQLKPFTSKLSFGASVVDGVADSSKGATVKGFALPTLVDLLDALGVQWNTLSTEALAALVDGLNQVTGAISDATDAAGSAQDAVDAATAASQAAPGNLLTALQNAPFNTASVLAVLALQGVVGQPSTNAAWLGLTTVQQAAIVTALNAETAGTGTAVATAQAALEAAPGILTAALDALGLALSTLRGLLLDALDVPLLSLGELTVQTIAQSGHKNVASVTGKITGLKVLGNDVLDQVTGSSTVDVGKLSAGVITTINSTINGLTSVVSSVLADATQLVVPAPKIEILKKTTSLDKVGPQTSAFAGVTGLSLVWQGPLDIPAPEVNPQAVVNAAAFGETLDIAANVATLSDASAYTTAAATTPTTPSTTPTTTPDLANTGLPVGLSVTAVLLLFASYAVRRFRRMEKVSTD